MSIHEQHLHPADFVQHLDDIRLYSFERVHLRQENIWRFSPDGWDRKVLDTAKAIGLAQARFACCGRRVDLLPVVLFVTMTRFPSYLTG
jgi:hypothetical protein